MAEQSKNLMVSLDGTWNNPYQEKVREDGSKVLKPSNPLKACRAVLTRHPADRRHQITYYDSGVGALGSYEGVSNRVLGFVDSKLGGAWGAGFEANVEQATTFLVHNYCPGDRVFLLGFSRGAAQARALTRFVDWMGGIPGKRDAYFVPLLFQHYLETQGTGDPGAVRTSGGSGPSEPLVPFEIEVLGVWDTVMALGSRFRAKRGTSTDKRSFHVGPVPAACVRHARQALAIDEQRYDFRPEVWLGAQAGQSLEQRWFPGVHSNVGGGYDRDGLANGALRWILSECESHGLGLDRVYLKHYNPHPQAKLYRSKTLLYSTLEAFRFRPGRGVRQMVGWPAEAKLSVDKSAIHRLRSDPKQHKELDLYRPANLIELLAQQTDLGAYLASLGLSETTPLLPDDVLAQVQRRA